MKFIKENISILLLVLMALCLIFFTVRLQALILVDNNGVATGSRPSSNLLTTLRRQLAEAILPPTAAPTLAQPTPTVTSLSTVQVITVVGSTPTAPATPTLPPLPTVALPTVTPITEIAATITAPPPTMPPPTLPPPIVPPTPAADFQLGYVDRGDNCPLITEIMQRIMEKVFTYKVATVAFTDPDALFAGVASTDPQQRVDWTLCYTDPDDRSYLEKHSGFLIVVGGAYRRSNGKGYLIMSNGPVKQIIQQERPCIVELLKKFKMEDADLSGQTAANWLAQHQALVQNCTNCQ